LVAIREPAKAGSGVCGCNGNHEIYAGFEDDSPESHFARVH
jgi:hypothetical protein